MIYNLETAIQNFLVKKETIIPPHLINPFLRIMETMEKPCKTSLQFNKETSSAVSRTVGFYVITPSS
jgi:hypothetical protein